MRIWIICSGESSESEPLRCTAQEYAAWRARRLSATAPAEGMRRLAANGRRLYVSPRGAAHGTAALLVEGAESESEPLLDEDLPVLDGKGKQKPGRVWRGAAMRPPLLAGKAARKARKACLARAEELIDKLESRGEDCILISHPRFISVLTDRLRLRGYCAQRTGFGRVRPFEQMLLSRRDEHCGGCQHNCLLSNPGCSIGRDKAARQKGSGASPLSGGAI